MPQFAELPRYYTVLVNHVEQAIEALDHFDPGKALRILIEGIKDAEKIYIEDSI